jgi:hypothetical protein
MALRPSLTGRQGVNRRSARTNRKNAARERTQQRSNLLERHDNGVVVGCHLADDETITRVHAQLVRASGVENNSLPPLPSNEQHSMSYLPDRFVSADGPEEGGTLTTVPIVFSGSKLELNLRSRRNGRVTVSMLNAAGKPIPGFEASHPLHGDAIRVRNHVAGRKIRGKPGVASGLPAFCAARRGVVLIRISRLNQIRSP